MSTLHEDGEVDFEEGIIWLPSHVLDQACDSKCSVNMRNGQQKHQRQDRRSLPRESHSQYSKFPSSSSFQRPKHATGGPGMQALFLDYGQKSCGTGVFLPQKAGTKPTKKPACAPVLLPARVIQALNIKVHTFVSKYNIRCEEVYTNESTKKIIDRKYGLCQSSSPDIFLPKEWTY
ncbi:uncharacterized protein [Cicer arietinum]|uniref:Uncharacterized protein LOC101503043 isoform X2 n=1 Tax=Cicer arietinum TaxID=3827 RepID=A0A1S2XTB8_CICAR|nr:uncharacterized protein LOC101503043 isoform X2 [Cicer arietinum]